MNQIINSAYGRAKGALNFGKLVELHKVRKMWDGIVGEKLARHTFAYAVKDGKLYVNADASPWLTEIEFIRHEILQRVNMIVDAEIRDLQCRVGNIPKSDSVDAASTEAPRLNTQQPRKVDLKTLSAEIDRLPEALRDTFRRVMQKIAK